MVKIVIDEDCGNAPKKEFVKDFLVAQAHANIDAALEMVTDNIQWTTVGHAVTNGKDSVKELLTDAKKRVVKELTIHNILSHGDRCAADGVWKFDDGSELAFAGMYVFSSFGKDAKIKEIAVYPIALGP